MDGFGKNILCENHYSAEERQVMMGTSSLVVSAKVQTGKQI
jgi:hypothetical protein